MTCKEFWAWRGKGSKSPNRTEILALVLHYTTCADCRTAAKEVVSQRTPEQLAQDAAEAAVEGPALWTALQHDEELQSMANETLK